ncbi:MAG: winged helix DNA-binding domain-containing protein [Alphaproteobacteria bacterium]|nr:MAG: winged helix DNA-binding domain-containing protein [Alphaproteobacteria bacterium]
MLTISAAAALAFRLERLHLTQPACDIPAAASALLGAQSQVASAGRLQLGQRAGEPVTAVDQAVAERRLVRLWAQRGTLHLVAAEDVPLALATRAAVLPSYVAGWAREGVEPPALDHLTTTIGAVLASEGPMTRHQLADHLAPRLGDWVVPHVTGSWGGALKVAAARGLLCHGPETGEGTLFAHLPSWISVPEISMEDGLRQLARRYLARFGPATVGDFLKFTGLPAAAGRTAWAGVATTPVLIRDHGEAAVLAEDADALAATQPTDRVIALAMFDPWLLAHRNTDLYLAAQHRLAIYRKAGWISAVLLDGGRVSATWSRSDKPAAPRRDASPGLRLTVTPLGRRATKAFKQRADSALAALHVHAGEALQAIDWHAS